MTKKDFILIARCILDGRKLPIEVRECGDNPKYTSHEDLLAELFADRLQEKNPLFNRDRFLKACGVEIEKQTACINCKNELITNADKAVLPAICPYCYKDTKK